MKKILFSLFAVLLLGVVLNCSVMSDKNPALQRQWMLVSLDGFSRDQLIANKAEMNLTGNMMKGKIQANAYMGCNRMSFVSEFKKGGKVKFSKGVSTMKACQDMNLESYFQKKIETMTHYSIEGHFLTLSDDQGNSMKFVAADWD
ncbi:META domain-containing protein [Chryseobacterium sp. ES2]|uniref:META domain-containing protein n=1 Tax=Chryseobacterium metallicongregator TaxID=3073042 RepID=A0ABU1EBL9_9FLAO|nr:MULTISPECIES: META domain-containing protein [Chryseobacterium]MDR4954976.1 META domain-containing protein [Chryseobacterium sp. ES2]